MNIDQIINDGSKYVMDTYKRIPIAFKEGKGCYLTDTEGKKYLDMAGGLAVNGLGHCPEEVVEAIKEQAEKLIHTSNLYWIENQVALAKVLAENSFGDKVFFSNSGAEANEAAIKLARKYAYKKFGEHKYEVIAMTNSFHGRTLAALAATYNKKYQEGYGPMPQGFKFVPYNDIEGLKEAISENTCAVIMEPIQGEGGVTSAQPEFMKETARICKEMDVLLIFDEVQCGIGRTGKLFAYENYNTEPDIMTIAKALASGFPIGAVIAREEVANAWSFGDHGTTFGGNPLATAAGLATMKVILEKRLWEHAQKMGDIFAEGLNNLVSKYSWVKRVKGKGLIIGLEIDIEGAPVVEKAFQQGVLINCTSGNVLRFLPPLIVQEEEINKTVSLLDGIFKEMGEQQ